jgi:hypothetical protein
MNDHLSTAQWLYSLGGIDLHANRDDAFRSACTYCGLSTAQWL